MSIGISLPKEDRVFISYRRRKLPQAAALIRRLNALSVKCWFDLELSAGENWRARVQEKLASVRAGIIAFTPDVFAEDAPWVLYEAECLRERKVAIPTTFETCRLQPPFSRDHVRNLEPWFGTYAGSAQLPLEARECTSGPNNSIEWQGVLQALESLLERPSLVLLDSIVDATARTCFGGDFELALERQFDLDQRTAQQPNIEDLSRLRMMLSDWIAQAPAGDPAQGRAQALATGVERLIRFHTGARAHYWSDGVRKGVGSPSSRIPGSEFKDAETAPVMRVISGKSYRIGSPIHEAGRSDHEGPQKEIQLSHSFAIGLTPVTVGQWEEFVQETNLQDPDGIAAWNREMRRWEMKAGASWREPGFPQQSDHPAVGVSWKEANWYCEWLSGLTGEKYRLPSEAEWEFAARAGSDGELPAGWEEADPSTATGTVPAASGSVNAFGLRSVIGNVWEWCQDVWVRGYADLPIHGRARERDGEVMRVARGGGWMSLRRELRCAARKGFVSAEGHAQVGFRVVREVS